MLLVLATSLFVLALLYSSNHVLDEKYLHPLSQHVPELQVDSPPLTVTVTQTSPGPSKTETVIVKPPVQPVVFSLVMVSEQSAREGVILLKVHYIAFYFNIAASCITKPLFQTAVMYTSRPLHFHIICDEAAQTFLEARFRLLTHPIQSVSVRFYRLSPQSMLDRVSREGSISTGHRSGAGTPPSRRFYLSKLLTNSSV